MLKKRPKDSDRRPRVVQSTQRSGQVFSYHANRSVRDTSQMRDVSLAGQEGLPASRKRTFLWLNRLPRIAALLLFIVIAAFCLQISSEARVVPVSTSAGEVFLRDAEVYNDAARNAFRSAANSNKITVNAEKITTDMQQQFPELKAVSISLPFIGNKPTVYIQPAVPKLILVAKDGMFVLDANGRALITGNQVLKLEELEIPVVTDESDVRMKVGDIVLPRSAVAFVSEVVGQLRSKGIAPSSLKLPPGTNELHMGLQGVGYYIKFNIHGDAREEAGRYLAAREYLQFQKKLPGEYIDVRTENRVYYR